MIIYKKKRKKLVIPVGLGPNVSEITGYELQEKTVDSSTVLQEVYSDVNYYGLYRVIVNPYVLDSKTVDPSTVQQIVTSDASALYQVIVNPYTLESKSQTITANGTYTFTPDSADGLSSVDISVNVEDSPVVLQQKNVDPSTSIVTVEPDEGYNGLSRVTVSAIDSSLDPDLLAENIKKDVEIFGVVGTFEGGTLGTKTVDSSTVSQTVTPDSSDYGLSSVTVNPYILDSKTVDPSTTQITVSSDANGLSQVTVNAVDASIDPDILPENIKKDVEILGVIGTFEGGTLGTKTVNSSTVSQTVTPDSSDYGLSSVTVNPYTLESATENITVNGQYTYSPSNADGLSDITVNVSVGSGTPTLQAKTVDPSISQVSVSADQGYDGLSTVTVNAIDSSLDPDLLPENIKKDVEIFGVTGTYEGQTISNQNKTVSSSTSSQTVTADSGYTGLGTVTITPYTVINKILELPYDTMASGGMINRPAALDDVSAYERIITYGPKYKSLAIEPSTNQQSYNPVDSSVNFFKNVTVNAVDASIDPDILPENIKKDVEILGVVGTYEGQTISNQNKTVNSSTVSQSVTADNGYTGLGTVTVNPYTLDTKTIEPSTNSQTVNSSADGMSSVTVNAVTAAIDPDIVPGNIKNGVDILGVVGTYTGSGSNLQAKTITANTTFPATILPDTGYDGLSQVAIDIQGVDYDCNSVLSSSTNQDSSTYNVYAYVNTITILSKMTDEIVVNPSTAQQVITPTRDAISQVTVNAVTSSIDSNIQAEYIKSGVTILGVTGSYQGGGAGTLQAKTVNSSTASQYITADAGYDALSSVTVNPYTLDMKTVNPSTNSQTVNSSADGLSSVTVNAVTSSIDSNIAAGNIKSGVTILGVQGTYTGNYDDIYNALLEI